MKRLLALASLFLVLVSCENSADTAAESVKDSLDSIERLKIESINEAAEEAKDTIQETHDSLKAVVDSVVDARN